MTSKIQSKKKIGKKILITKPIIKTRRDLGFLKKKKKQASDGRGWAKHGKVSSKAAEKPELTHFSFTGSNPRPPDSPKTSSLGKRSRNKKYEKKRGQAGREEAHVQQVLKPACPSARAVQQGRSHRHAGTGTATNSSPRSLQREKALAAAKTQRSQK